MIDTMQPDPVTLPARSFARVTRSVLGYALLVTLMFVSPLYVFVPAALFACGIRNGKAATFGVIAFSTLAVWIVHVFAVRLPGVTPPDAMLDLASIFTLVAALSLPALVVLPLVQRGEPFGRVLLAAILVSFAGFAATEVLMRNVYGFSPLHEVTVRTTQGISQAIAAYDKPGTPREVIEQLHSFQHYVMALMPAIFVAFVAVFFILSLVMFGRLKAWRDFITRRRAPESQPAEVVVTPSPYLFRNLSYPDWLLFAFVIGGITPLATGTLQKVTANILAVVVFLYVLQGLAIFRWFLVAVGAGFGGVMFAYLVLGILTITRIAPFLLGIAGLFDSFFDFRHFRRKDSSDESHPH